MRKSFAIIGLLILIVSTKVLADTTSETLLNAVDQQNSQLQDLKCTIVKISTVNNNTTTSTLKYYFKSPDKSRSEYPDGTGQIITKVDGKLRITDLANGSTKDIPTNTSNSTAGAYASYLNNYIITITNTDNSVYTLQCLPMNQNSKITKMILVIDSSKNVVSEITKFDKDNNIISHITNSNYQQFSNIWYALTSVTEENMYLRLSGKNSGSTLTSSIRAEMHYSDLVINSGINVDEFSY